MSMSPLDPSDRAVIDTAEGSAPGVGGSVHPLDRAIWTALTTRQSALALSSGAALRFDAAFSPFAASADGSAASLAGLADLVPPGGEVYLQGDSIEPPAGFAVRRSAHTVLMVAERIEGPAADFDFEVLRDADGPEMMALAHFTKPGPFAERTHELGRFVGVRHEGRLVAMAGERLKAGPYTEVSGVCTHPDHRGRGYAGGLMKDVAWKILERGEKPFPHSYADNLGAIALYERLGFAVRSRPMLFVLERL